MDMRETKTNCESLACILPACVTVTPHWTATSGMFAALHRFQMRDQSLQKSSRNLPVD